MHDIAEPQFWVQNIGKIMKEEELFLFCDISVDSVDFEDLEWSKRHLQFAKTSRCLPHRKHLVISFLIEYDHSFDSALT